MKDEILSRALRVDDCHAGAAFSDPLRRRVVLQLMGKEASVSELAGMLDTDLKRLHYHVAALVKMGLLRIARIRPRAGRSVKLYTATADAFFVPATVTADAPSDVLAKRLREALSRSRERSQSGVVYYRDANGAARMRNISRGEDCRDAVAMEHWQTVRLSHADAAQLTREIIDRIKEFASRTSSGAGRPHLLHIAMVADPSPEERM